MTATKSQLWATVRGRCAEFPHAAPVRPLPCLHEGDVVEPCRSCGGGEDRHVRECDRHGRASRVEAGKRVAVCANCTDYQTDPALLPATARVGSGSGGSSPFVPGPFGPLPIPALPPFPSRLTWVSTAQLVTDAIALAGLIPPDAAGIVGIPRSGLLPATVIATHLHLPLYTPEPGGPSGWGSGAVRGVPAGSRGRTLRAGSGPLVVVDDTVYGGGAMARVRSIMNGRPALYAAVYVRPEAAGSVDLIGRMLPYPHLLEWNIANNGPFVGSAANPIYGAGVACDLDGILCHDELSGGRAGTPYLIPRAHPVRLIATGRPERDRTGTEAWLEAHGVRWDRLAMLPDGIPLTPENAAAHKAREFVASGCGFFLESCPIQSELIYGRAARPVICPAAGRVFGG